MLFTVHCSGKNSSFAISVGLPLKLAILIGLNDMVFIESKLLES